jgi:hypothetical protein
LDAKEGQHFLPHHATPFAYFILDDATTAAFLLTHMPFGGV